MNDEPLAFFVTWTVYGTFLQGDARGWRKRGKGSQTPQPNLEHWHAARLRHPVLLFNADQRAVVEEEINRLSEFRGWRLWASAARSNHVHVVVYARGLAGSTVRDQLKANCTRALRERWPEFQGRPIWTVAGDWQCINECDDLEEVILYVTEAQDRKGFDSSAAGR